MGALAITALLAERPPASANALACAALLLVAHRPEVVLDLGFDLSMSATFGLVVLGPRLHARWEARLPTWLARPLAASVGAELMALPWSLARFHGVALLGPLVNLAAVPWMGVVLALSFVWTALALAAPAAARALAPLLDAAAAPFGWPGLTRPEVWLALPLIAAPMTAAAVTLAVAAALLARRWRWRLLALAGVAAGFGMLLAGPRRGVELILLDVGQGDAVLLRDGKRAALVDGGGFRRGDIGSRVLLPALLAEGVRRLDALVMTHPDDDHCRGLVDIAAHLPVREVWMGPGWDPAGCAGRLAALPGTRRRILWAGEEARVGRWRLLVLHPEPGERWGENDRSLVLRAEAFGKSALLTGDVERWAEHRLLACCREALAVDVLKVAHHGSRTSSGEAFLDAVRPRLALISAGVGNLYRHPSPEVEERLASFGARVLVTSQVGAIRVAFDSEGRTHVELPGAPR
jgi:competence protein ComEC